MTLAVGATSHPRVNKIIVDTVTFILERGIYSEMNLFEKLKAFNFIFAIHDATEHISD